MSEVNRPQDRVLDEDAKSEILLTLLEQAERAKRITADAANDDTQAGLVWQMALRQYRWWWYPRCPYLGRDWVKWRAFARRRERYAWGTFAVAGLSALIALGLPDFVERWIFLGQGLALALVAGWQLDVSNRELELIESFHER